MNLNINGESQDITDVCTVPELVEAMGLPAAALLVEHNGTALHRREWETCSLKEGDSVWFLRIAAGG